ncbi:hypothetical protein [Pseudoprimorskyibacter insulae]|uniref:Uncharacterized protein n=1 Tax=Pseudoprimorskyibacter insulae TaxID=1695997 RepID=A0A2R8AY43_9RHOB|nr:hypothetical protein [Pseudoprimorskyibacter insulae]SPF80789.1 hypothetical protein PRI8871_02601 [Pseudoprimorskyibacter insulae]
MKLKTILASLALGLGLTSAVQAGIPEKVTRQCPFGFGKATYTATLSCSSFGGRIYISGKQPSSCEFVTVLPLCSKHGVPLYTSFKKGDAKLLRQIVKTEGYKALLNKTRFERAAYIDDTLQRLNPEQRFIMLRDGYFHEGNKTYSDPAYLKLFKDAANAVLKDFPKDQQPWFVASAAYIQARSGEVEKARRLLAFTDRYKGEGADRFRVYARALRACFNDMSAPSCDPYTRIDLK